MVRHPAPSPSPFALCTLLSRSLTPSRVGPCARTLGDLDGATRKLFLFGDAFAEHGKEIEGSILVVLAPKISRPEDGAGEVAFSVDKGAQLFKLGWAADFGFCKAERKDGKPCTMAVNVRVCEYCSYHAGAALKALEARPNGRMDASGSARAMTERRKLTQVANRAGQGSYLHHHAAGVVGGLRQTQPAKPAAPIGKVNVEELRRLAAETGRANSQGARLVTHLANSAGGGQPSLALPQPRPGTVGAQSRMRMTGSSVPQALHPPKAGGAQRPQQPHVVVMMDNDAFGDDDGLPMDNFAHLPLSQRGTNALDKDPARMQAVALSKQIGGFKRPDPGGPRQRPPLIAAPQQRPLQQTTAWNPPAGRASALSAALPARAAPSLVWAQQVPHASAANNNKRSLSAAFGAVTAGDDAAAGSIHAALAEEDVELNLQRTLDLLAKREGLAEAAEKVTSIKVHAFKCMCGALTERQRPECLDLGHHGRTVHVEKRFWECRHCHRRCLTLDSKHPPLRPCTNCGGINFDATPLGGRRKVDVQDGVACREALLPRGEEHAFSLKSLR